MAEELLPVIYSARAIANSLTIKNFLLYKFTQREVDNFYKMLERFGGVVSTFPEIYPKSTIRSKSRRAVLSKQLSVFYIVHENQVSVVGMIDNRMGYDKWPQ
jgi:plasmid stabilization system protein ParE